MATIWMTQVALTWWEVGLEVFMSYFNMLHQMFMTLQYLKFTAMHITYDEIEYTLKETWNEKSMMYQAYL